MFLPPFLLSIRIKKGAPMIAVSTDIGISFGDTVLARVSTIIMKPAPMLMDAGMSFTLLLPKSILQKWGTMRPTHPT